MAEEPENLLNSSNPLFNLDDYLEDGHDGRPTQVGTEAPEVPEEQTKDLNELIAQLKYDDHQLDHKLKGFLGPAVTSLVIGQVIVMNLAFMLYIAICFALKETPNNTVVIAFLTTSTAEVIGLALVVTRYLFPEKGPAWNGS